MDAMDTNDSISITYKFGGYWLEIRNEDRQRYEGGKQKTVKMQKYLLTLELLKEKLESICSWLKEYEYELHYHIGGTSPKKYQQIISDIDVMNMLAHNKDDCRAEIVVITKEGQQDYTCLSNGPSRGSTHALNLFQPISENTVVENVTQVFEGEGVDDRAITVGARFSDALAFKHALRTNAISNNFGVKIQSSNKSRVVATCSFRGCSWRVRATVCSDGLTFQVRKLEATHSCPGVNRFGNRQATSTWVAEQIQETIKMNPNIPPRQINNNLERMYGLSLPYMKLWRSRERARDEIFGAVDDNYKWVPALQAELISRNLGSHIAYEYEEHDYSFRRFFVSFKVCIDGFRAGCRHLIGLDACHLKSKYLGVLLSANSLDGNNGIFTIAFAVAESESKKTWNWFLENLAKALGSNMHALAFISDMEKGLCDAAKRVFPDAEHRVCMRHLWKNVKKNFHCGESHKLRDLVWQAANAYIKVHFEAKVSELLRLAPHIHAYLFALPYKWSRSQFSVEIKNINNTNNMSESFNSWITEAREKPVVDLVDTIRGMMMEQRAARKMTAGNWRGDLVPYAEEHIRELSTRKEHFVIRQSSFGLSAEVEGVRERHEVFLDRKACSCGFWQLSGLPCSHAIALIVMKDHPLWQSYVDECYHVKRYKMAYEGPISTLPGKEFWVPDDSVEHPIGVPNTIRPRGRPKKNRMKNFLETTNKRSKAPHKCGRCGGWGHHRSTCKSPLTQSSAQLPEVIEEIISSPPASANLGPRQKLKVRRECI